MNSVNKHKIAKHVFWFFGMIAMVASIALVGCGSKDSGGAQVIAPGYVVPLGPMPNGAGQGVIMLAQGVQVVDSKTFELFLQNYQLCSAWMNYSIGDRACSSYTGAAYTAIQVTNATPGTIPTSVMITVGAGAGIRGDINHSGWTTRVLTPSFNTAVSYTNNNAGFTAVGPYGVRMVVNNGFPGAAPISFDLVYSGIVFLRGTLNPI